LAFSAALLESRSLSARDRELLILRVGLRTGCRYLWSQHVTMAGPAGLSEAEVDAVGDGPDSDIWSERDRDLLLTADELLGTQVVSDSTWDRLTHYFDEADLLEILFFIGSYICLAMVLNSAGLEPQMDNS
jgi:alkylhydroperoxidase family enzyme